MSRPARGRVLLVAGAALLLAGLLARYPLSRLFFHWGMAAERVWDLETAADRLGVARRLDPGFVPARLARAEILRRRGELEAAQQELDSLTPEAIADPHERLRWLEAAAKNRTSFNQIEASEALYRQALDLALSLAEPALEGRVRLGIGRHLYDRQGRLDEGEEQLELALALAHRSQDEALEADVRSDLGRFYWWFKRQRHRTLDEFYRPALALYERLDDRAGIAITLANIALVHLAEGDYPEVSRSLERSSELYEEIGDVAGVATNHSYLGALYVALENYDRARDAYLESLEINRRLGDRVAASRTQSLLVDLYLRMHDFERGVPLLNELIEEEGGRPTTANRNHHVALAHCYLHGGELALAREAYERALELDQETGEVEIPFQIKTLNMLGQVYLQSNAPERAAEVLERAERLTVYTQEWDSGAHHLLARADLLASQGRPRQALATLAEVAEIETRLAGSPQSELFDNQYEQVFTRLHSLLFAHGDGKERSGDAELASEAGALLFRFLEQMRYRSFRSALVRLGGTRRAERLPGDAELEAIARIDALSSDLEAGSRDRVVQQELRRAYGDYEEAVLRAELEQADRRLIEQARPITSSDVERLLPSTTALVPFVFAGEQVLALVVSRFGVVSVELPVTRRDLRTKVKLLRSLLFASTSEPRSRGADLAIDEPSTADWEPLILELRRILITPLEKTGALERIDRLGLIPVGFLHDLPFAVLAHRVDGARRYLVEEYALFSTPSATLWSSALEKRAELTRPERQVLSFGIDAPLSPGLPPLEWAAAEAEAVAAITGGRAQVNTEATESRFKELAPHSSHLHLSVHGLMEPRLALHSRLMLAPDPTNDGELTVREILSLRLRADLLVLGACETGLSRSSQTGGASDLGRVGFVEAFLHAGARSVIASLFPISDRATVEFMRAFYTNLERMDAASALAATQRAMLRGEIADRAGARPRPLTHPSYWAPFILVGA